MGLVNLVLRAIAYFLRILKRQPVLRLVYGGAFSGTVLIALGAAQSALDVLSQEKAYSNADRLVLIWNQPRAVTNTLREHPLASDVISWRDRSPQLVDIAAMEPAYANSGPNFDIQLNGSAHRLSGAFVTPNIFSLLGVRPLLGSLFDGRSSVAVLSYDAWRSRFGGADVVGRSIDVVSGRLSGGKDELRRRRVYPIVGILPREVRFPARDEADVWVSEPWAEIDSAGSYIVIGLVRPGVQPSRIQTDMAAMAQGSWEASGQLTRATTTTVRLEPFGDYLYGPQKSAMLFIGCGIVVVIGISIISLVALVTADQLSRAQELHVRLCLGARRRDIVLLLVAESSCLTWPGAMTALLLALCLPSLIPTIPESSAASRLAGLPLAGLVILLTAATTLLSSLAAMAAIRFSCGNTLLSGARTTGNAALSWIQRAVLVCWTALVLVCISVGTTLLVEFEQISGVPLGFRGSDLVTAQIDLLAPKYLGREMRRRFFDDLLTRLRAEPGIIDAGLSSAIPFRGADWTRLLPIRDGDGASREVPVNERQIDSSFLSLMEIALVSGRSFSAAEVGSGARVAIISRSLANRVFGDPANAIGKTLDLYPTCEIIGVVEDVRFVRPSEPPKPAFYIPIGLRPDRIGYVVVRSRGGASGTAERIRAVVSIIDPEQPVDTPTGIGEIVSRSLERETFFASTAAELGLLAATAFVLGVVAIGLGTVARRRRDLAIRAVLGARPIRLAATTIEGIWHAMLPGVVAAWLVAAAARVFFQDKIDLQAGSVWTDLFVIAVAASTLLILGSAAPALLAAAIKPAATKI